MSVKTKEWDPVGGGGAHASGAPPSRSANDSSAALTVYIGVSDVHTLYDKAALLLCYYAHCSVIIKI